MRKIVIEVPEDTCADCQLIQIRVFVRHSGVADKDWGCPFNPYKDLSHCKPREVEPVKACRDAEVSE
jgi:hypothetical protein